MAQVQSGPGAISLEGLKEAGKKPYLGDEGQSRTLNLPEKKGPTLLRQVKLAGVRQPSYVAPLV